MNLMGTNADIKMFCPPGVELSKVFGKEHFSQSGFKVGDLRKNDSLSFFLVFDVNPNLLVKDDIECFYTLNYTNVSTKGEEIMKGSLLRLQLSKNEEELKKTDKEVEKIFEVQKIMEKQKEVQSFLENNKIEDAVLLMDYDIGKLNEVLEEIEDDHNKKIAEIATRRVEEVKQRTIENKGDKAGNIEKSKQAYAYTSTVSLSYSEL